MNSCRKKNLIITGMGMVLLLLICISPVAAKDSLKVESSSEIIVYTESPITYTTNEIEHIFSEKGLDYFAYMNFENATAELKPLILEARTRIIYGNTRWVADGHEGYIKDKDGNIISVLPQFHDIFPADWDLPPRYVCEEENMDSKNKGD